MIAKTVQHHFSTTLKKYDQPHSFNMHIVFLRPVTAGKAEIVVKDSRVGSGVSTTQVTLSQKAKELVVAYVSWVCLFANRQRRIHVANRDTSPVQQYKHER